MDEVFAQGSSPVHRLDPRVKLLGAAIFSVEVALIKDVRVALLALFLPLLLINLAGLSWQRVFKRLLVVNAFVLMLWVVLPFSTPGERLLELGPFCATAQGVMKALTITVKSNAILLATIALLGTSSIFELVHGLRHLRVPDKLVQLFFFCFRYIHVLEEESGRLHKAMKVRGFEPSNDLHTLRSYAYLVGQLLLRGYDRSERVHKAMLCRGFDGRFWLLEHFVMKGKDAVAFLGMLAWCTFLALLQWGRMW